MGNSGKNRKGSRYGSNGSLMLVIGLLILSIIALIPFLLNLLLPTKQLILATLKRRGYSDRMASYWVAVSQFETANWTSKLYTNSNNLFGMMFVNNKRPNHQSGEVQASEGMFATFRSRADSVKDLADYMDYMKYPKDFETLLDLIQFMAKKNYFYAPNLEAYYEGVRRYYNQNG